MILPCEVAVKSVVPAVKSLVATQLIEEHGLKQDEVAKILGISQSAVSRYTRKNRGQVIKVSDIDDIRPLIDKMTALLLDGRYQGHQFLAYFCQTCELVRKSSLMCPFCRKMDTNAEIRRCRFCLDHDLPFDKR
ncbi:MAG TPA: helix-turn-helix domain-containing protein [Candidatus Acidoferrum sp.]|nr:helix-turn-helix domain-containing protein [Candidatus Acidoferrum sp.]